MTDRVIKITLPEVGIRQLPLSHTLIEFRASPELEWTTAATVPADADPQEVEFLDVNPGTMYYRGTVFDTANTPCRNPSEISADVPYDPPGDPVLTIIDT